MWIDPHNPATGGNLATACGSAGQQQNTQQQQVKTDLKNVRQHIQSVIGTLEKISTTFSGRLDAYEQQRSRTSQQRNSGTALPHQESLVSPMSHQSQNLNQAVLSKNFRASSPNGPEITAPSYRSSNDGLFGSTMVTPSVPPLNGTPSSHASSPPPIEQYTQNERTAYQNAFNLLRAKDYAKAAGEFSAFLRTFPNSALADNSQYWLGECYYGQRRFQEAIDEFERVFALYSSSSKVPASLLKIGYSHLELQQPSMALAVFQQLVRTYPQSQEAIKAHGRLQQVNALLQNPS